MKEEWESVVPYENEFALKYWIPIYGALKAALNFGKRESLFHDTPSKMPKRKRMLRQTGQLIWLGYQGMSYLTASIGIIKSINELEKILK